MALKVERKADYDQSGSKKNLGRQFGSVEKKASSLSIRKQDGSEILGTRIIHLEE